MANFQPEQVVRVPRAVAEQYWHRPWDEVLAAAERHDAGLSVVRASTAADPDVAFLREGVRSYDGDAAVGTTRLERQNW